MRRKPPRCPKFSVELTDLYEHSRRTTKDIRSGKDIEDVLGIDERRWRRMKNEGLVPRKWEVEKLEALFNDHQKRLTRAIEAGPLEYATEVYWWHRDGTHRREMNELARSYYDEIRKAPDLPLIAKDEWLPDRPIPLDQITLRWDEDVEEPV